MRLPLMLEGSGIFQLQCDADIYFLPISLRLVLRKAFVFNVLVVMYIFGGSTFAIWVAKSQVHIRECFPVFPYTLTRICHFDD